MRPSAYGPEHDTMKDDLTFTMQTQVLRQRYNKPSRSADRVTRSSDVVDLVVGRVRRYNRPDVRRGRPISRFVGIV